MPQTECFAAGVQFARTEGIVPAPEPTHAMAACIREALACRETGEEKVILTALCGHGHFDLPPTRPTCAGEMVDEDVTDERLAPSLRRVRRTGSGLTSGRRQRACRVPDRRFADQLAAAAAGRRCGRSAACGCPAWYGGGQVAPGPSYSCSAAACSVQCGS